MAAILNFEGDEPHLKSRPYSSYQQTIYRQLHNSVVELQSDFLISVNKNLGLDKCRAYFFGGNFWCCDSLYANSLCSYEHGAETQLQCQTSCFIVINFASVYPLVSSLSRPSVVWKRMLYNVQDIYIYLPSIFMNATGIFTFTARQCSCLQIIPGKFSVFLFLNIKLGIFHLPFGTHSLIM